MSGFAQGLLAGFSTVDQAMTRRKELGLREAQLAQQQKNNERDFEFAQSQFEHRKENDQRTYDLNVRNADREYALKEREHKAAQNYRNASLGLSQQRLQLEKYNQRRLEYNDMIAHSQPLMEALGKAIEAGDQEAATRLFGQLPKGHPLILMSNEGYAAKAGQAVINLQKIFGDKPDMAIDSLNTPENLDVLSGVFAPELQQRIGMPDSTGEKTIKEARIGSIVPAQQEGYVLIGLDLTYSDGSTAHKPVTEYGSAHPDDQTVLAIPVDKAIAQVRDRSKFAEISKNYGYFMPKQQGLSLKELQKGASNVAADAIKNGGNAQAAVDEYYAATGSQPHQQKIQQQKLQQQVINWAGDDPDKLSFARNVAARQPEMLEPQNQKLLENGYANFLRIQKARGEQARDESASSASQFIRGLKQNYAQ
ncbi:hypothetical protein ED082_RS47585 [Escherichia coli]|uniref:Uncharacterized protein n=5 Tax=root TaxID=1 RepID=A0A0P0ZD72_9CAUD|nr:hypothetical protein [Escherichia coli]YP_009601965.1 hypothetical protein FDH52_gp49 [Escherichia phage PA28]YP_009908509.1 hypothetical protein H3H30_gp52 [Stx converting phage vB_EcoS_P27]EEW3535908.1 hypothetical protein [Escherichia coli O157:NM]EEX5275623.1 hypothetical protein [Escherichia coli O157]EFW4747516.1 hypothetical protein [Shigella sonnei]EHU94408.1 hypothetical protein ECDEC4B_3256 [Escherichia coli DEC4B]EJH5276070.1 hypothetical protein [Escherichia coli O145:H28]EJY